MPFHSRLEDSLQLIRGEFREVADLRITLEQAEMRWNLEPRDLELILETFVDVGFLRHSPNGSYYRLRPRDVAANSGRPGMGVASSAGTTADPMIQH
jgi:hypothetical protein